MTFSVGALFVLTLVAVLALVASVGRKPRVWVTCLGGSILPIMLFALEYAFRVVDAPSGRFAAPYECVLFIPALLGLPVGFLLQVVAWAGAQAASSLRTMLLPLVACGALWLSAAAVLSAGLATMA